MFNKRWLVLLLVLAIAIFTVGCGDDDDDPVVEEFTLMTDAGDTYFVDYATSAGDPVNVSIDQLFTWLTDGDDTNDPFIVDWRSADLFAAGHIEHPDHPELTVNWTITDLDTKLDDLPRDRLIVNICWTGHLASYATAVMNLVGQDPDYAGLRAANLLYAMCSVTSDPNYIPSTNGWANEIAEDEWANALEATTHELSTEYDFPTLETGENSIADIVKARFDEVYAGGWAVSANDVFNNPENYFIVNYWPTAQYESFGHIPGAYCIQPKSDLTYDGLLKYLPTDGTPIAVYCYTGQTSTQVTAYLRLLGYNAKSLRFGVNGFAYQKAVEANMSHYTIPSNDYSAIIVRQQSEFEVMAEAGGEYFTDYVTSAGEGVNTTISNVFNLLTDGDDTNDPFIIDWRAAADFAGGHIMGAVNWSLADLATKFDELPTDQLIVNVCYTGQSASYATSVMNMLAKDPDYAGIHAVNLAFGMCSVTNDPGFIPGTDRWSNAVATDELGSWETTENTLTETYTYPALTTGTTDVAGILAARHADALAGGWSASYNDFLNAPEDYFVVNYWPTDRYLNPGHLPGAYCIQPKPNNELALAEKLDYLPTDKTILVYCYTGQTSAQVAAFLRTLGYDAKSLLYGANGFSAQTMAAMGWSTYQVPTNDYSGIITTGGIASN